jgi:hypothetical protein
MKNFVWIVETARDFNPLARHWRLYPEGCFVTRKQAKEMAKLISDNENLLTRVKKIKLEFSCIDGTRYKPVIFG